MNILFSSAPADWPLYQIPLENALRKAGVNARLHNNPADPTLVDVIVWSPASPIQDFAPFANLRAVQSLWAGVEKVVGNKTLRVPLCRMVDPSLTSSMTEWVLAHCLRYHLGIDKHILHQDGIWRNDVIPPMAQDRHIGVLGLGALGSACAISLSQVGFTVSGWSKHPKTIAGVDCFSGAAGIAQVLGQAEILVLLLPLTPDTENLMDVERFALMPKGAYLLNAGRGHLIVDDALIDALNSDRLRHATLDVFRQEPLPSTHAFWRHPGITVTPHVASHTRPETVATMVVENIRRLSSGDDLLHVVDMKAGY